MLDKIVTLANEREYCIVAETDYNGKKYYCGVEYFEEKKVLDDKYYVFKEDIEQNGVYLTMVEDNELIQYFLAKMESEDIIN